MSKRKIVYIILDGAGDRPQKELNWMTPFEHANTPTMDRLAREGICGIMDTISPGIPPGSDTAHLTLFGYDAYSVYTGRGPFEAAGIGLEVKPGDIAFRFNFATIDEKGTVVDRRAGRIKEGTTELIKDINNLIIDDVQVLIKEGTAHRGAVVLRGDNLSHEVTSNDPKRSGKPVKTFKPLNNTDSANKTARVLNELYKITRKHLLDHPINKEREKKGLLPANGLLLRGGGEAPAITPLTEKYNLDAACVAGGGLYKGVAKYVGMKILDVDGATGGVDTNLDSKMNAALNALKDNDFIFIHIKATDNLGHDGKAIEKSRFIERVDNALQKLVDNVNKEEVIVVITSDHSTPCDYMDHSADPVPVVIWSSNVRVDSTTRFNERSCAKGDLHRIKGLDLFRIVMDLSGRTSKFGA